MLTIKKTQYIKLFFTLLLLLGSISSSYSQKIPDRRETSLKFAKLLFLIENYYVDTVNLGKITDKAIVAALKSLDPHSSYLSKKDLKVETERLEGSFDGIGIVFQIYQDSIMVVSPIPGGPSDKVGIQAGDRIVKIDDIEATGDKVNNKFVFDNLRGEKGSKVTLSIVRKGNKKPTDYTVTRDKIPLYSMDAAYMLTNKIGYIKLNRFARNTVKEYKKAIDSLQNIGLKSLVLDLRGNSGGYLSTAIELTSQFIPKGKLVVFTEGEHTRKNEFRALGNGDFEDGKLIVLINEGSASASEIVSGAIQDWDRGIIMGRRSFGKGLVQQPFPLTDGSQIRLTISRYHTPSGRCIQRSYAEGTEKYRKDIVNRIKNGELTNKDSIHFPDSLKYKTENGRIVYGGGGIMPDIFIPWDSTEFTSLYSDYIRKGVFNQFIISYLQKEKTNLVKKYPNFNDFQKSFKINNKMMDAFLEIGKKEEIEKKEDEFKRSENLIKLQIKALIAQRLFTQREYYQVINEEDETIHKAIELIKSADGFDKLKNN
ncbi:MAG: S41 family peptidase [Bacteroidales bacterium]